MTDKNAPTPENRASAERNGVAYNVEIVRKLAKAGMTGEKVFSAAADSLTMACIEHVLAAAMSTVETPETIRMRTALPMQIPVTWDDGERSGDVIAFIGDGQAIIMEDDKFVRVHAEGLHYGVAG